MKRRMRNPSTGRILPCTFADCEEQGDDRITVKVPHDAPRFDGEKLVYIFCSERHRAFWKAAATGAPMGSLPTGSRGLLGPLGLPL